MTHKEKINLLKDTIIFLYEKEGRNKSYISRLLNVDRKILSNSINDWQLIKANIKYLSPSNQKFVNKNRSFIKFKLDNNITHGEIAKQLNVTLDYLKKIIYKDEILNKANEDYSNRRKNHSIEKKQQLMDKSKYNYNIINEPNEEWKPILGYEKYYVSNIGRIKSYVQAYNSYKLLTPQENTRSKRLYVGIDNKYLSVARLVAFAFVDGHSIDNNTVDHIDGNYKNNRAENLEWVSQSINNKRAYKLGRTINRAYMKNKKFKKLIVDGQYEFKTITAFAKFYNVSQTQAHRYINKECKFEHTIEFIY